MAEGVKRIPVREGRIRGTLFLPPGNGPFPGKTFACVTAALPNRNSRVLSLLQMLVVFLA